MATECTDVTFAGTVQSVDGVVNSTVVAAAAGLATTAASPTGTATASAVTPVRERTIRDLAIGKAWSHKRCRVQTKSRKCDTPVRAIRVAGNAADRGMRLVIPSACR